MDLDVFMFVYEMGWFGFAWCDICSVNTVTAVDSGSKALRFLGLVEDEKRNEEPPTIALEANQVQFYCKILSKMMMTHSFTFLLMEKLEWYIIWSN